MAKTLYVNISMQKALQCIEHEIQEDGRVVRKLDSYQLDGIDEKRCIVVIYERYYYRVKSNVTLTITLDDLNGKTRVTYAPANGEGTVYFDFGAAKNFSNYVTKALKEYII